MNESIGYIEYRDLPARLMQIADAPHRIFYRGCKDILYSLDIISIVGTRKNTDYGCVSAEKISLEIARKDIIVVSGLALGIDAIAMRSALDAGGRVIGVLASGLDDQSIGPRTNFKLAMDILDRGGVLISEYPRGTRAEKHFFPRRNRLISGLALGTIVIEADLKSGSLITAKYALNQGRDVFAVPGNISSPQSDGTNFLISQGAVPLVSEKEILYFYGWENS